MERRSLDEKLAVLPDPMSAEQFGALIGISPDTIRAQCQAFEDGKPGGIRSFRVGKQWRITKDAVREKMGIALAAERNNTI